MSRVHLGVLHGQLIGQTALLACSPILTRLYGPSAFGGYQLALSIAVALVPLATLRYDFVLQTTSAQELFTSRAHIARICVAAATLAVFLCAMMVLLLTHDDPDPWVAAYPAALLAVYGLTAVDNAALVRVGASRALANRNALVGLAAAALQVGLGLLLPSAAGLVVGMVAGRALAVAVTRPKGAGFVPGERADQPMRFAQSALLVFAGVVGTAASSAVLVTAGAMLGASATGVIALAQRVAGVPVLLLSQGIGQVLSLRVSRHLVDNQPGLARTVARLLGPLILASAGIAVCLMWLAPPLIPVIFGDEWASSGPVTQALAVPIALQLVGIPMGMLLGLMGHARAAACVQALRLLAIVAGTAIGSHVGGTAYAAALWGGTAWAATYVVLGATFWFFVRQHDTRSRGQHDTRT
ncbi:oligosaccharide flippase family protein [Nocardioides sp. BGMRC 2183]|nr:oligosaccharide flippase family protein [Nocardioides sp. BGMRC 2183]